jgi:hypothetical protein
MGKMRLELLDIKYLALLNHTWMIKLLTKPGDPFGPGGLENVRIRCEFIELILWSWRSII